ncbi:MAG: ATP-dependent DNA helicase [Candidatus Melainabacteria bacterium RIFOXYA12_FULL_32_12]|nr:MAG: ATP-dependent DNA helicase [Candidatus Melainabacteria bacterium RIFOXYA2_FULL_32_9]OGI24764.1 MAG: ATP-dependent DNA helicase [Candidatus Melainabacteria bacterium RIFOXYA12_FULL_32_12]
MTTEITKNNLTETNTAGSSVKKYVLKKSSTVNKFQINYEAELNESQYQAVINTEGPVLVIAGAGTGKTRTLVYRVARMVESGIKPDNILLLTFTRKASEEMLSRASIILDSRCENIAGGTFHSFANMILRKYADQLELKNSFTILDRSDAEDAINLIRGKIVDTKKRRFPRKATICDIYSKAINKDIAVPEIIESEYSQFMQCTDQIIEICQQYGDYKRSNSLLDYDDLLLYLKVLLLSSEKIRKKLSETYKYIMIDEYQDTNSIQAEIVKLLAYTHNNVMAVGDDSQSIYSFRGANFKNIINFPKLFEGAKVIKLEQNYRSTQEILDVTNDVIKYAYEKYSKNLFTIRKNGEKPAIVVAPNQQIESEFVSQRILELQEEGISLNNMAVLARSSRTTYNLEVELGKKGIPFRKFGGYKFIDTAHIKDIIAHLRVIVNREDQISWNRILLLLNGIGNIASSKLIPILSGKEITDIKLLPVGNKSKDQLNTLINSIETVRQGKYKPSEVVEIIANYYHPILADRYDDFPKREKDLEHFKYLAEGYRSLESFLSDLVLEPPESSFSDVQKGAIHDEYLTLSTIHSAKGLEWDTVFIIGAVEGKFPSIYSYDDQDSLEEERRLMYVATTRAKNNLYITYPIDMFDYNQGITLSKPSRFVEKIPENLLERWCLVQE